MNQEILHARKITAIQFLILAISYLVMMLNGFANVIISYTAPAIARDWSADSGQLGLVFSAGLLGMTIGAMFISSAADLYGRRLVTTLGVLLMGIGTLAAFYIDSVNALILSRIMVGIGIGTLLAVLPAMGGEYSPKTYRNFIVAALVSSTSLGSVIGGLICAWWIPLHGWRSLYLYTGLLTLAGGVLFFLAVPESISHLVTRNAGGALEKINRTLAYLRQPQITALPERNTQKQESASVRSLLAPSRRILTLTAWVTFFMGFASLYFIISWLPKLLVDSGISEQQSIQAVVILTAGSMTGALIIGWISQWWKLSHLIATSFAIATLLILGLSFYISRDHSVNILVAWALAFLIGITLLGAFGNLYGFALSIYPDSIKVTGLGWCIGLGRGGAIISPSAAGMLLGIGISAPSVLAWSALSVALAAIGILLIKSKAAT